MCNTFSVLVTDENIYLATCRCNDRLHLLRWIQLKKPIRQTKEEGVRPPLFVLFTIYDLNMIYLKVIFQFFSCAELYLIKRSIYLHGQ